MTAFMRRASVLALCWAACVSAVAIPGAGNADEDAHWHLGKRLTKADKAAIQTQAALIAQNATGIPPGTYTFRNVGTGSYISYVRTGQNFFPDPTATAGSPVVLEQNVNVSNQIRVQPSQVRRSLCARLAD